MRAHRLFLACLLAFVGIAGVAPIAHAAAPGPVSLTPARLLDTRKR